MLKLVLYNVYISGMAFGVYHLPAMCAQKPDECTVVTFVLGVLVVCIAVDVYWDLPGLFLREMNLLR